MPLAKCVRCKKMFNKEASPVCSACQPEEDSDHEKVRNAIEKDPSLNAKQVAELTSVDLACVKRMLDAGLIATAASLDGISCGMCGAPAISASKRLCQACLDRLNMQMAKAQSQIRLGAKKDPELGGATVHEAFDDKRR